MNVVRSAVVVVCSSCAILLSVSASAGAYATLAPPPQPSSSSGLPDGRVYEEVSPPNKHGYQAGAIGTNPETPALVGVNGSVASPNGDAVSFSSAGPAAETDSSGLNLTFVAEKTLGGWVSRSTMARGMKLNERDSLFIQEPEWYDYSPNLSHLAYETAGAQLAEAPAISFANFYLLGSDPLAAPTWLLRSAVGSFESAEGRTQRELVGMTPDASVIYIAYQAKLLAQDASRSGWGVYEYHQDGSLTEATVLPNGSVPPTGGQPAATTTSVEYDYFAGENNPASFDNQLSEDGKRLFFVAGGELYVHEILPDGSERSILVSASRVPGHIGEQAASGVSLFANLTRKPRGVAGTVENVVQSAPTYAYASPDGSHVFFQSIDQLTGDAPSGSEEKVYDFDVDSEALEYLPGVTLGGIVTAAKDGSSFVFVNGSGSSPELDLWSAGPGGGNVRAIAVLPGGGFVGPGRMAADGSVLVFQAQAPIAGFNNGGMEQIYRYEVDTNELDCLSCPPAGIKPSGNAYLSATDQYLTPFGGASGAEKPVNDVRGVSSDGGRVFFDSPDPLVSRDTDGQLDMYEWEDGTVFLISSGTSSDYSLFLDNSESGGDAFFATNDELVEGDNDGGFDVYDARIPRPGDNPPPAAVPCSGDVCQGPPSVPNLLGAPPSATFNGVGNIVEEPVGTSKSAPKKAVSRKPSLSKQLRACRKLKSKRRRVSCERQARKKQGSAANLISKRDQTKRGK